MSGKQLEEDVLDQDGNKTWPRLITSGNWRPTITRASRDKEVELIGLPDIDPDEPDQCTRLMCLSPVHRGSSVGHDIGDLSLDRCLREKCKNLAYVPSEASR